MITVGIHGPMGISQFSRNRSELISNDLKGERVLRGGMVGNHGFDALQGPGERGVGPRDRKRLSKL